MGRTMHGVSVMSTTGGTYHKKDGTLDTTAHTKTGGHNDNNGMQLFPESRRSYPNSQPCVPGREPIFFLILQGLHEIQQNAHQQVVHHFHNVSRALCPPEKHVRDLTPVRRVKPFHTRRCSRSTPQEKLRALFAASGA